MIAETKTMRNGFKEKTSKPLRKKIDTQDTKDERRAQLDKDWAFYEKIWNSRPHRSEVSGTPLYKFTTMYFHHIIPKSKWKEGRYLEENIILLTPEEHAVVENDIYKYEEVNKRREQLKIKYNL